MMQIFGKVFTNHSNLPSFNDFTSRLLTQFGGADTFAAELHAIYKDTTTAKTVKTQILLTMLKLLLKAAETQQERPDLASMSNDELLLTARSIAKEVYESEKKGDGWTAAYRRSKESVEPGEPGDKSERPDERGSDDGEGVAEEAEGISAGLEGSPSDGSVETGDTGSI